MKQDRYNIQKRKLLCVIRTNMLYYIYIWVYWSITFFFQKDVTVIDWRRTGLSNSIQATIWRWAHSTNSKTRDQEADIFYAGWSCQYWKWPCKKVTKIPKNPCFINLYKCAYEMNESVSVIIFLILYSSRY